MDTFNYDHWSTVQLIHADLVRQYVLSYGERSIPPKGLRLWASLISSRYAPVLLYRLSYGLNRRGFSFFAKAISTVNFFLFGIEIAVVCRIGPGFFLPHTQGTVIGAWSVGANATIFQGVTLGAKELDFSFCQRSRPTIGDDVTVGAGAMVLGGITLGYRSRVGANSVVLKSLPPGALAVGAPARVVGYSSGS
jgi:serine O-acetyltransferase